jgi:hypothetical protein
MIWDDARPKQFLIEGEVSDTYGGDYTYRDVWASETTDGLEFFQQYTGAKPSEVEQIFDTEEIKYLTEIWKLRYER